MKKKITIKKVLKAIGLLVLVYILLLSVAKFIFTPFVVSGNSMSPHLESGEKILTNKFFKKILRSQIVTFHSKFDQDKIMVSRVIAVPGDEIEIKDGKVFLNGTEYFERYLLEDTKTAGLTKLKLKNGEYFVMGDNRGSSADSRTWGPVDIDDIISIVKN